jgi:hypothetical protein
LAGDLGFEQRRQFLGIGVAVTRPVERTASLQELRGQLQLIGAGR